MNVEELIAEYRSITDDRAVPYLWSDMDIAGYADDAVNEACERARLIEDRVTSAVCNIALVAGVPDYPLHPSIFFIKRITHNGQLLEETSSEKLHTQWQAWETRTGQPQAFVYDQSTTLRIFPIPKEPGAVKLTVYRLPLASLSAENENAVPEIPVRYHKRLLDWMLYRGYSKQDADTQDVTKAQAYAREFERSFGQRISADVQRKHRDRKPPQVAINRGW